MPKKFLGVLRRKIALILKFAQKLADKLYIFVILLEPAKAPRALVKKVPLRK